MRSDSDVMRRLVDANPAPSSLFVDAGRTADPRAVREWIVSSGPERVGDGGRDRRRRRARQSRIPWVATTLGLVGAVAVAVVAVVVVVRVEPAPSGPAVRPDMALVAFSRQHGEIVARITDPLAAASQLDVVFEAHHLDISVQLVAASPSLVGTIVEESEEPGADIRSIAGARGSCLGTGGAEACTIGLVIPADFRGRAGVALGRAARPGESYEATGDAFSPGEVLHCSGLLGQTPSAALPVLEAKGLTVRWGFLGPAPSGAVDAPGLKVPSGYIVYAQSMSATVIAMTLSPTYPPPAQEMRQFAQYAKDTNRGC